MCEAETNDDRSIKIKDGGSKVKDAVVRGMSPQKRQTNSLAFLEHQLVQGLLLHHLRPNVETK